MLSQTFSSEFSEVRFCDDGLNALDEYKKFMPEWVFMDIKMKKMDGLEAAKQIILNYPMAKIIMVTNYDSNSFRKEAKKSGVIDYILKDELYKIFDIIK